MASVRRLSSLVGAVVFLPLASAACHRPSPPPLAGPDAGAARPISQTPGPREEEVRSAVARWSTALDQHDVAALKDVYAAHVAFYGRDVARSGVLDAKSAALGRGSTFHQRIEGRIDVQPAADGFVASFHKVSGSKGKMSSVLARLLFRAEDGQLRIAEESDGVTDRSADRAARDRCEAVAARVVEDLPQVKRQLAEAESAIAASDSGATLGGIGPDENGDGSFSAGLGVHTEERFEDQVSYDVDAQGTLHVTTWGDGDLALPRAILQEVARACGGGCARALSGQAPMTLAQVPFADIARAAVPTFRPESGCASVVDASVADCRGEFASAVREGEEPDASAPGAVNELGRFALGDGRAAVWLGTGLSDPGALQQERGFLAIVRLDGRNLVVDAVGPWLNTTGGGPLESRKIGRESVYVEDVHLDGTGGGESEDGVYLWHETGGRLVLAATIVTSASRSGVGTYAGEGCDWSGALRTTLDYGKELTLRERVTWDRLDSHGQPCKASPGHKESSFAWTARWKGERLEEVNAPKGDWPGGPGDAP